MIRNDNDTSTKTAWRTPRLMPLTTEGTDGAIVSPGWMNLGGGMVPGETKTNVAGAEHRTTASFTAGGMPTTIYYWNGPS